MAKAKRGMAPRRVRVETAKDRAKLAKQELARKHSAKLSKFKKQAHAARDNYKANKKERGKIVFIGIHGQRSARAKGRKGYLIYVTKTGKKWFLRQHIKRDGFKPRAFKEIQPVTSPALRGKAKAFQHSKLVTIGRWHSIVKGHGEIKTGGPWDFSDKVVNKIARSIQKTLHRVASHRVFNIRVGALVRDQDGQTHSIDFSVPIEKADHVDVRLDGLQNFVRQKFYAFLAQELQIIGFVTSGSSNHVRMLSVNKGRDRDDWRKPYEDAQGRQVLQPWKGAEAETVTIQMIEWKLEQAKIK